MIALDSGKEQELIGLLEQVKWWAQGYQETELTLRAREGYQYYYGQLPRPINNNASKWVDRSVWESVNGVLQDLLNVFTSGNNAVEFTPLSQMDGLAAQAATAYVNKTLLRQNPGYNVLSDVFKEALIARLGWVKRYWCEKFEEEEHTFIANSEEEAEIFVMSFTQSLTDDITVTEVTVVEDTEGLFEGSISTTRDVSYVKVEYVPFEEMIIDPDAESVEDAQYIAHRTLKSRQDLLDLGFDPEQVMNTNSDGTITDIDITITDARAGQIKPTVPGWDDSLLDPLQQEVWLYEHYIHTSIPDGSSKLWQIFECNRVILHMEEVSEKPFDYFTPFPVPNEVFGESIPDITREIQDVKTALMRGYIDNINNANHPSYIAMEGQYNRRHVLEKRPNSIIEVKNPNAFNLFPYNPLPNGLDQLLNHVEMAKEARTGVSRTTQGLNPDIYKNDNAFATVNMMMSAAQNRLRMICRNIAETGMRNLMRSIYRIARENDTKVQVLEVNGQALQIRPSEWPQRDNLTVAVAIGSTEQAERAQNLVAYHQFASQNQLLAGSAYGMQEAHHLADNLAKALGLTDVANYNKPLQDIPPPPPNPMQDLQLQQMQAQIAAMASQSQKLAADAQAEIMKIDLDAAKFELEQQIKADEMNLRESETRSKVDKEVDGSLNDEKKTVLDERRVAIEEKLAMIKEQELEIKRLSVELKAGG